MHPRDQLARITGLQQKPPRTTVQRLVQVVVALNGVSIAPEPQAGQLPGGRHPSSRGIRVSSSPRAGALAPGRSPWTVPRRPPTSGEVRAALRSRSHEAAPSPASRAKPGRDSEQCGFHRAQSEQVFETGTSESGERPIAATSPRLSGLPPQARPCRHTVAIRPQGQAAVAQHAGHDEVLQGSTIVPENSRTRAGGQSFCRPSRRRFATRCRRAIRASWLRAPVRRCLAGAPRERVRRAGLRVAGGATPRMRHVEILGVGDELPGGGGERGLLVRDATEGPRQRHSDRDHCHPESPLRARHEHLRGPGRVRASQQERSRTSAQTAAVRGTCRASRTNRRCRLHTAGQRRRLDAAAAHRMPMHRWTRQPHQAARIVAS